jgi:maltose 6'-phosphate phosphatase
MKPQSILVTPGLFLIILLFTSCQTFRPSPIGDARCNDVTEKGYINVLTINLFFLEIENRNKRLEALANFAATNDVDVILLQEVVNGVLVNTENSAQDLRDILNSEHDLDYNIQTAFEVGVPGLLSLANALLSRCEIRFSLVHQLPKAAEIEIENRKFKIPRNVLMSRLEVPDKGKLDVYTTHLCSRCEDKERADQIDAILEFMNELKNNTVEDNPTVFGGDLNFDLFDNEGEERFLYEKIIDAGFIDAYADFVIAKSDGQETLDTLCEDEDNADEHCTVGVTSLNGDNARRVDYIFAMRFVELRQGKAVFNNLVNEDEPSVSDHAGVFVSLECHNRAERRGDVGNK